MRLRRTMIWLVAEFLYTLVPSSCLHNKNQPFSVDRRTDRIIVAVPHETQEIFHENVDMGGGGVSESILTFTQHKSLHLLWTDRQNYSSLIRIGPKNTKLVEDIEILLPVKFR